MKKLLILMSILFVSIGMVYSQSITVTSPNGGENWKLGSTYNVTWTSNGVSGNIGIKLFQNGSSLGYIAQNVPVSSGSYSWTISNIIGGGLISAGSNYQIQVKKSGVTGDLSDGNFTISKSKLSINIKNLQPLKMNIKVLKPSSGNVWVVGRKYRIIWENKFSKGKRIYILLCNAADNKLVKQICVKNDVFLGSQSNYLWTVPNENEGKYKIKVVTKGESAEGMSKAFSLRKKPTVKTIKIYGQIDNYCKRKSDNPKPSSIPCGHTSDSWSKVGYHFVFVSVKKTQWLGEIFKSIIYFDVSQFKGKGIVVDAKLHYNKVDITGSNCKMKMYKIDSKGNKQLVALALSFLSSNPKSFNLSTVVWNWISHSDNNFGILLTPNCKSLNKSYKEKAEGSCISQLDNIYLEIKFAEKY